MANLENVKKTSLANELLLRNRIESFFQTTSVRVLTVISFTMCIYLQQFVLAGLVAGITLFFVSQNSVATEASKEGVLDGLALEFIVAEMDGLLNEQHHLITDVHVDEMVIPLVVVSPNGIWAVEFIHDQGDVVVGENDWLVHDSGSCYTISPEQCINGKALALGSTLKHEGINITVNKALITTGEIRLNRRTTLGGIPICMNGARLAMTIKAQVNDTACPTAQALAVIKRH